MKKITISILAISALVLTLLAGVVSAATTGGVSIAGSKNAVEAGETIVLTIKTLEDMTHFELTFDGITESNSNITKNPYGASENLDGKTWYIQVMDMETIVAGSQLLTIEYTVDEDAQVGDVISLGVTAEFGDSTGTRVVEDTVELTVIEKSSNNDLKSISINGTEIVDFDKDTLIYNVQSASTVTILAAAEDSTATVLGNATYSLASGTTMFKITVTAENGAVKTYIINVENTATEGTVAGTQTEGTITGTETENTTEELDDTPNTGEEISMAVTFMAVVMLVTSAVVFLKK